MYAFIRETVTQRQREREEKKLESTLGMDGHTAIPSQFSSQDFGRVHRFLCSQVQDSNHTVNYVGSTTYIFKVTI